MKPAESQRRQERQDHAKELYRGMVAGCGDMLVQWGPGSAETVGYLRKLARSAFVAAESFEQVRLAEWQREEG